MRAKVMMPTDEEEAAIQRGIAADPDNPELTEEDFARMRPAAEMLPKTLYAELTRRPNPAQVSLSIQVPPDVADGLRAMGPGWQSRAADALAKLVGR